MKWPRLHLKGQSWMQNENEQGEADLYRIKTPVLTSGQEQVHSSVYHLSTSIVLHYRDIFTLVTHTKSQTSSSGEKRKQEKQNA